MSPPLVSVIVPAYNRLELVRPVLDAFERQRTQASFEVVVVDDGSQPPAADVVRGRDERFRLLVQANRGRASAINAGLAMARGDILIVCDSDIVPGPGFVEDHMAFHRVHRDVEDTHLGALEWGVEPLPFAELLGPRANPRMIGLQGPVPWTLWYTDNWSLKRKVFDTGLVRFDEAFHAWGWEDLDLAHRLATRNIRNHATPGAVGRHLQAPTLDSMLEKFATSAPNLLLLAGHVGSHYAVETWLAQRRTSTRIVEAGEAIIRRSVAEVEAIYDRLSRIDARIVRRLATSISGGVFRCGMQRGFVRLDGGSTDPVDEKTLASALLPHADVVRTVCYVLLSLGDSAASQQFFESSARTVAAILEDRQAAAMFAQRVVEVRPVHSPRQS